jgi:hypothetical protein
VSNPGLFGHLATRLSAHPENIATEALAYVLHTSISAASAFEDYLGQVADVPTALHYETQSVGEDGTIPDLVGLDRNGHTPVLLEAKFWAGLTSNQPVSYLHRLPPEEPGLLVFVVPSRRLELIWTEILTRTSTAGIVCADESGQGDYRRTTVGPHHTLAITSWRALLTHLADAAAASGDLLARSDLAQLTGLCDRMDSGAFIPLTSEDLTGALGLRLTQYTDLIDRAVTRLILTKTAATTDRDGKALISTSSSGMWGRYFAIGDITCLLRLSAQRWAHDRATPIWLQLGWRGDPPVPVLLDALTPLRAERRRVFPRSTFVDVAIDLPIGRELDDVVEHIVQQVQTESPR